MTEESSPSIPRVLAVLPGFIPSTIMNVISPLLRLRKSGKIKLTITLEYFSRGSELDRCDLVVYCRNSEPQYGTFFDSVVNRGIPYIYDIDDNLFDVPEDTPLGQYYRDPTRIEMLNRYLSRANLVRVYSQRLKENFTSLNPNIALVTPPLDWDLIQSGPKNRKIPVKIVYSTSRNDDKLNSIFLPAIQQVLATYQGRISIDFLGYCPPEFGKSKHIRYVPFRKNYASFMTFFSKQGYDIGLAPLLDDEFHRNKTNNKYREYAACGIAGIYSNVPVYAESVLDAQTGLLVENTTAAWTTALSRLINDTALREKISKQAFSHVKEKYRQEDFDRIWFDQISALTREPHRTAAAYPNTDRASGEYMGRVKWITKKIRNVLRWLFRGDLAGLVKAGFGQLQDLWIVFKLNRCKII